MIRYNASLNKIFFVTVKSIGYMFSAVNEFSLNPRVGPLPNNNMYFLLLSICEEELISAPKITTF